MFAGPVPRVLLPLAVVLGLLAWLLAGAPAVAAALPGTGLAIELDGLSGFFLTLALLERAAAGRDARTLAGTILTLLAADGMTLLAGVVLLGGPRRLRGLPALLLLAALALLGGLSFDAMRLAAETVPEAALIALVLAAAVAIGGPTGTYLALRLLLDVASPLSSWAGTPVILAGAAMALIAAAAACGTRHLPHLLDALGRSLAGFALLGAGMVLAGTTNDVPAPAAAGLAVVLLASLIGAGVLPVWRIVASLAVTGTGGTALAGLGGVLRMLPLGGLAALIAGLTLALVPPGAGFMMLWQAFAGLQALPANPLASATAALAIAVSAALLAQTALRLLACGLNGASPANVAEGPWERALFAVFGLLSVLAGIFPALVFAIGAPAAVLLAGTIRPAAGPGYLPWAIAALMAGMAAIAVLLLRRPSVEGHRSIAETGGEPLVAPPARLPRKVRAAIRQAITLARRLARQRPAPPTPSAALAGAFMVLILLLLGQALP